MSPADPAKPLATADDLLALGDDARVELIGGEVVPRAATFEHSAAQGGVVRMLGGFVGPLDGPRGPGGWWIIPEAEVLYGASDLFRHDVAGWRRHRVSSRLSGRPARVLPDWVCEIRSPPSAANDTVVKLRVLHRNEVRHYWILEPIEGALHAYRWSSEGYKLVAMSRAGETVRAEPFDAIEIALDDMLGRT